MILKTHKAHTRVSASPAAVQTAILLSLMLNTDRMANAIAQTYSILAARTLAALSAFTAANAQAGKATAAATANIHRTPRLS